MLVQPGDYVLDEIVAELQARLQKPSRDYVVCQGDDVMIVPIRIGVGQGYSEDVQRLTGREVSKSSLG